MADSISIDQAAVGRLVPINALSKVHRDEILRRAEFIDVAAGERLPQTGGDPKHTYYLLSGELELLDGERLVDTVDANTDSARFNLSRLHSERLTARARTAARLLRIDRALVSTLLIWMHSSGRSEQGRLAGGGGWLPRVLGSALFTRIPAANIQRIFAVIETVPVKTGDVIIQQGDIGEYYYIIQEGRCVITRVPVAGAQPIRLAELREGDSFGEEALISDAKRNATVAMLTDGAVLRLTKADFVELIKTPIVSEIESAQAKALSMKENGVVWLDVRIPDEHKNNGVKGSLNIPLLDLRRGAERLDKSKTYIVYCNAGRRSAAAAFLLSERGIRAHVLKGGLIAAVDRDQPDSKSAELERDRLQADLANANAEIERALKRKTEIEAARRAAEDQAALTPPAGEMDSEHEALLAKLAASQKELQAQSARANEALAKAQRHKLELETALREADAATEKERAKAEAACARIRSETEARLQEEEQRLGAEYSRATEEMDKLKRARDEAERQLQQERERLEAQFVALQKGLDNQAERIQQELDARRQDTRTKAEQIRAEQLAAEERLRAETEAKLNAERRRLETEFADSLAKIEEAQQVVARAEVARRAALERAQRLEAERKAEADRRLADAASRRDQERERLATEAEQAEQALAAARKAKGEAEQAMRAAQERLAASRTAKDAKADKAKMAAMEARVAEASQSLTEAELTRTDIERARKAAEARAIEQQAVEQEVRLQLYGEAEDWARQERMASEEQLEKAKATVERMRLDTEEASARRRQVLQSENALMAEISAQLAAGAADENPLEEALSEQAYAEQRTALARTAEERAVTQRRATEEALTRAREQIARLQKKIGPALDK